MKLKELLPKKTIDMLIQNKEEAATVFKMDFKGIIDEKGNLISNPFEGNEKNWQKKARPYFLWFIANATLEDVKEKDINYYNRLYSDIRDYKGETEITMKSLLRRSRSLRGVNQILRFYH
jgi:hypothetical protein